ncbi:hypothetical protein ABPG75_011452 [Micractinium tetrahymenae]
MVDAGKQQQQQAEQQAAAASQQKMMLLQVSETDWAVVMLDEESGGVRELQIDAATAHRVQAGELSPEELAAMLAQQQARGGGGGEGEAS